MFTLRKNSSKRASLSFLPPQNHSEFQQNCSSLLVTDDLPRDNLIFLMLNSGCFREIMRSNSAAGMQCVKRPNVAHKRRPTNAWTDSTASICNQICSLLVFSSREFTQNAEESAERIRCSAENKLIMDQQITVLLDAPKVPMKALRLVLRACQSALAYKIRQCVLLEQDWFVQHRVALDVILHEKYDFKVIVCPHSKLLHYIGLATLFDLQSIWSEKTATTAEGRRQQRKSLLAETENNAEIGKRNGETLAGKWVDQKKAFSMFFAANPSYSLSMGSPSANVSTASLLRLMRKDRTILIELVEHDLDSVTVSPTSPMPAVQQNQNRALLQEKFYGFIEEKSQTKGRKPADVLSNFGRTRLELPLVVGRNAIAQRQQKQRHSLLSNGFSSSFTDFSSMNEEQLPNKPQKEGEFEYICSSSVGSIIERNGGNWPTEKPVDEFVASVHRVAESVRLLLEWTSEHGEKQLSSMNELWWKLWTSFNGEIFYLDFIERERTTLTEETEEKVNELANAKDEMDQVERRLKTNGFLENPSKQLIATVGQSLLKAEMRIYRLRNALNSYKIQIDNARRFKEIIEEFHKECDALLLMLYGNDGNGKGGRTLKMNGYQTEERINSIRKRQTNIEKYVGLASETSSSFRFLMRQNENGRHQSIKKMSDCAEKAIQQISTDFDALTKRRHRFDGMVELWVRMINSQLSVPLRKEVQHNVTASFCGDLMSDGGRETTKRKERQHI